MTKPITPKEVNKISKKLPDEVLDAFNELIVANIKNGIAVVKLKDAVDLIRKKMEIKSEEIQKRGYLDVEDVYRKAGWGVKYDQPCFNESGEAFYTFAGDKCLN